jgi:transposase
MWTPAARAQLAREAIPYATCLTDAEWRLPAPFMPPTAATGRPRSWPMRLIVDEMLDVRRTGCAWEHLPREFPLPGTVHRLAWSPLQELPVEHGSNKGTVVPVRTSPGNRVFTATR